MESNTATEQKKIAKFVKLFFCVLSVHYPLYCLLFLFPHPYFEYPFPIILNSAFSCYSIKVPKTVHFALSNVKSSYKIPGPILNYKSRRSLEKVNSSFLAGLVCWGWTLLRKEWDPKTWADESDQYNKNSWLPRFFWTLQACRSRPLLSVKS